MYSIGHTIGNSRSNSLGVPTLAWLPLDDKCSTGSIVGHAPCLPDPPYLCLSFVKSPQKKYLYLNLGFLLISDFNFDLHFFDIPSHLLKVECVF